MKQDKKKIIGKKRNHNLERVSKTSVLRMMYPQRKESAVFVNETQLLRQMHYFRYASRFTAFFCPSSGFKELTEKNTLKINSPSVVEIERFLQYF